MQTGFTGKPKLLSKLLELSNKVTQQLLGTMAFIIVP